MSKKKVFALDVFLGLFFIALDQLTKYLAVIYLKDQSAFVLIKGVLELDYLENRGAAFGILQGRRIFLIVTAVVFIVIVAFFLSKVPLKRRYLPLHILGVMIIAGGLGNMIDRIRLDYVVDFISFVLIDYPIFNLADSLVVVSVIMLFIFILFVYKEDDLDFFSGKKKN